jgi:Fe-S oxidoreductase
MPGVAEAASRRLATSLREAGARTVITACPTCRSMLSGHEDLEVVDLITLLARAL